MIRYELFQVSESGVAPTTLLTNNDGSGLFNRSEGVQVQMFGTMQFLAKTCQAVISKANNMIGTKRYFRTELGARRYYTQVKKEEL
jgi:hypothetical protein